MMQWEKTGGKAMIAIPIAWKPRNVGIDSDGATTLLDCKPICLEKMVMHQDKKEK